MTLAPIQALNSVVDARMGISRLKGFKTLANLAELGRLSTRGNPEIKWNVDAGGGTAVYEAITANSANTATDVTLPATLGSMGTHRLKHQFPIMKTDIAAAKARGNADLMDLFGEYTDRAILALMREINRALFLGDGTATFGGIHGLASIMGAGSYAGITTVQSPLWAPIINANGGTNRALTTSLIRTMKRDIEVAEAGFDFVVCHPDVAGTYERVFETVAGINAYAQRENPNNKLKSPDLGFTGGALNGVPIVSDPAAPNNQIIMFDSSDLYLYFMELPASPNPSGVGSHVVNRSYGIPIHIQELSTQNTTQRVFEFAVYMQCKAQTRKSFQAIRDLTIQL